MSDWTCALAVAWMALASVAACSSGPCPRGQEPREERHAGSQALKAKGCVAKNDDGNYRLQGRWEYFYANGQKQAEGAFKDGNAGGEKGETGIPKDGRGGKWVIWFESGQKMFEGAYRSGKLEGPGTEWHESGQKLSEAVFNDGQLNGLETTWHANGQKKREAMFRNGQREGLITVWHENGQKSSELNFKDDKEDGIETRWYPNGKLGARLTFKNGDQQGSEIRFEESEESYCESSYKFAAGTPSRFGVAMTRDQYLAECRPVVSAALNSCRSLQEGSAEASNCEKTLGLKASVHVAFDVCARTSTDQASRSNCKVQLRKVDAERQALARTYALAGADGGAGAAGVDQAESDDEWKAWAATELEEVAGIGAKLGAVTAESGHDPSVFADKAWRTKSSAVASDAHRLASARAQACLQKRAPGDVAEKHDRLCRSWSAVAGAAEAINASVTNLDPKEMGRATTMATEAALLMQNLFVK